MSQVDIARALEVHREYVSDIETGKRNPTLATIKNYLMRLAWRLKNY